MWDFVVTILTPTYNRKQLLPRLFESLCAQTAQKFQWLVIDDGSIDGTDDFFKTLPPHDFSVVYYKKENGGKHTALNYAHPYIKGELVLILDSDDYLLPEAIETIEKEWRKYRKNKEIGCLSYQKCDSAGCFVSSPDDTDTIISDHISYRINQGRGGDRCEVLRADLLKQYPFPVFDNERFMSEGWLWNHVSYDYKTVYRNVALYVCEYLEGGLSRTGRSLRMKSPLGMMESSKSFFCDKVRSKIQRKEMWLYIVYGKCAGFSVRKIAELSGRPIKIIMNSFPGICLYFYWKKKYL